VVAGELIGRCNFLEGVTLGVLAGAVGTLQAGDEPRGGLDLAWVGRKTNFERWEVFDFDRYWPPHRARIAHEISSRACQPGHKPLLTCTFGVEVIAILSNRSRPLHALLDLVW